MTEQIDRDIVGRATWIPHPADTNLIIDDLRPGGMRLDWVPLFIAVESVEEASDRINLPHEDYPDRVDATTEMLKWCAGLPEKAFFPTETMLHRIHEHIFAEADFRGRWRDVMVQVGRHVAPPPSDLKEMMQILEEVSVPIETVRDLWRWYYRFETIHPYRDGNGRTGGVVVAAMHHRMTGGREWLAPLTWQEETTPEARRRVWDWLSGPVYLHTYPKKPAE